MTLSVTDLRSADRYEVHLDADGSFDSALRYTVGITTDPIVYAHLSTINPSHQHLISEAVWKFQQTLSSNVNQSQPNFP